jgi:vacuolar protein sorting-associated protein 51
MEFSNQIAEANLNKLVKTYWFKYCDIVKKRFEVEQNLGENTIIVRAVDRFYRRIHVINKQIPNVDLSIEASNIALYAALIRVNFYLQVLKEHFSGI